MPEHALTLIPVGTVDLTRRDLGPGTWGGGGPPQPTNARARLGFGAPDVPAPATTSQVFVQDRNLLPEQYWKLYRTSPDVRACVDSITRRVATWDWTLEVLTDPRDTAEYERLRAKADEAERWLAVPNVNGETWQELLTRTVNDLLLYDAGAWELNQERGRLRELVPWLGSEWLPVYSERNVLLRYDQTTEDGVQRDAVSLPPERLVYFSLFRNNRGPLGLPLLDTLVNECVTVLLASEHAMLALDADEIPPGLLVLGGVAGAAAERARADLQQMRGRDHRLRVVSSPQPNGIKAEWVELRHTPKDLQLLEVVEGMQRAIWRTFGVMPVELGVTDGVPRASAVVQVDVSSSHLIGPILELMEARINAQVIPLILGADAERIAFRFDRDQPLTPEQRLALARAGDLWVRRGIVTVNEARADMGRLPVDGGDVPLMDTNEGPLPLFMVAAGERPEKPEPEPPEPPEDEDPDEDDPDDDDGGEPTSDDTDDDGDDEAEASRLGELEQRAERARAEAALLRVVADAHRQLHARTSDLLPSEWQDPRRFAGMRTVDLRALADLVMDYTREVGSLWADTSWDLQALLADSFGGDSRLSPAEAEDAQERMLERVEALRTAWEDVGRRVYTKAAELGVEAAQDALGGPADTDPEQVGREYADRAAEWLRQEGSVIGDLRRIVRRTVYQLAGMGSEAARYQLPVALECYGCGHDHDLLAAGLRARLDELDPDTDPDDAVRALDAAVAAQAHRIDNWTGTAAAAAYTALDAALRDTQATYPDTGDGVVWYVEWVDAGGNVCPICRDEAAQGIRPLAQLSHKPGEDTYCRGRCRCVLVLWTEREVGDGTAVKLAASTPGGPDA